MYIERLTEGDSEALSLTDVKEHLRIDETSDHDFLLRTITAVRRATEKYLQKTLVTSQWRADLDEFPSDGLISLPYGPVVTIDSLQYYDADDVQQVLASTEYEFDASGRLRPVSTKEWPATYDRLSAISITYTAGVTHAGKIDEDILHAMRLMVGHYDQNRENTSVVQMLNIPHGYRHLLNAHRAPML